MHKTDILIIICNKTNSIKSYNLKKKKSWTLQKISRLEALVKVKACFKYEIIFISHSERGVKFKWIIFHFKYHIHYVSILSCTPFYMSALQMFMVDIEFFVDTFEVRKADLYFIAVYCYIKCCRMSRNQITSRSLKD